MLQKLKKVKLITGALADAVKINPIAMVRIKIQLSNQQSLPLKRLKRFTCVAVRKLATNPFVMEATRSEI